jgi:hypothetical protein
MADKKNWIKPVLKVLVVESPKEVTQKENKQRRKRSRRKLLSSIVFNNMSH